jgi:hypothetical protein
MPLTCVKRTGRTPNTVVKNLIHRNLLRCTYDKVHLDVVMITFMENPQDAEFLKGIAEQVEYAEDYEGYMVKVYYPQHCSRQERSLRRIFAKCSCEEFRLKVFEAMCDSEDESLEHIDGVYSIYNLFYMAEKETTELLP